MGAAILYVSTKRVHLQVSGWRQKDEEQPSHFAHINKQSYNKFLSLPYSPQREKYSCFPAQKLYWFSCLSLSLSLFPWFWSLLWACFFFLRYYTEPSHSCWGEPIILVCQSKWVVFFLFSCLAVQGKISLLKHEVATVCVLSSRQKKISRNRR